MRLTCPEAREMPTKGLDTRPRTERLENRPASAGHDLGLASALLPRSSGFPFQWFWIEVFSFLPNSQHNRRHLARQGQPRHGRLHSPRQQILIKITPGIVSAGGELDQIQFLLGHVSIQTTERYLDCKQKLRCAVNDRMGIEPDLA